MKDAAEVMEVKCVEPRRVGSSDGWLLSGPGGESVFAWDGCVLRASRLGGIDFEPPLGLLQADKDAADWRYTGSATIRGKRMEVEATLTQGTATADDRFPNAKRVGLLLKLGANEIELVTVFAQGVGIVGQEQRNNGRTVSRAQLTNDSG